MIKSILVPLDGSELSERVLWTVKQLLLEQPGVRLTLLQVVEPLVDAKATGVTDMTSARSIRLRMETAQRHVAKIVASLAEAGVEAEKLVVMGDPALEILRKIDHLDPSLVAMATHGRSGPSRWVRGSVAERVLRGCKVPLLLVNPMRAKGHAQGMVVRRILVPLDGSAWSAMVLPLVEAFALCYGSEVVLMRVVESPVVIATDAGYPLTGMPEMPTPEEAVESLRVHKEHLEDAGIKVRTRGIVGGPAGEILDAIDELDVDLVAMTSHGHSGLDRWLFGSVAEKVARHCPCPLLIQRVAGLSEEAAREEAAREEAARDEAAASAT